MPEQATPLADTDDQLGNTLKHLAEAECQGHKLEMAPAERAEVLEAVTRYASEFIGALPQRKAFRAEGYERSAADAGFEPGEGPGNIGEVLSFIGERVDNTGLNPASGGHLGYIPGGGIPEAALGDYLAGITNRYAGTFYASPGAVRMENAMVQWSGQLVGYGKGFGGNLASGGSMANLIAIATARSAKGIKGKDLERTVVYLSDQAHHSLGKGLRIAGLGECVARKVAWTVITAWTRRLCRRKWKQTWRRACSLSCSLPTRAPPTWAPWIR
ncbi:MAG TPA: pyridoxal-dependent decarboxylase [Flavobacteriales bacterium]|nr:pyridoxal-dependent decarboxylase [Flavobacteriales bacterium]